MVKNKRRSPILPTAIRVLHLDFCAQALMSVFQMVLTSHHQSMSGLTIILTANDPRKGLFPSNQYPTSVPHAGRHSSFSKLQVYVSHVNPGGFGSAEDQQASSGFKQKLHVAVETKTPTFSASHKSASREMCRVLKWESVPTVLYRSEPLQPHHCKNWLWQPIG